MASKYKNVKTVVDGVKFASKKEARRYGELKALLAEGQIADLELHPPFRLVVNGQRVCTYVADFAYTDVSTGQRVVEDAKGVRTAIYRLKKKLLRAVLGIDVVEV